MSFLKKDKKYGLVMPKGSSKSGSGQLGKVASVFNDDSSEEDEKKKKLAINRELNVVAEQRKQTHQTRKDIQKALEEDPSVYQYDEIYDEMEQKKVVATQATKTKDKKPRYIASLLKSAEMRKREQERRVEGSVQKEREKEGDEFADKESFVTSAYRQKMIDQAEEEERLRKQDEADAKHDVRKQKDLSQFYRNLLDNNVAMGASQDQTGNSERELKGSKKSGQNTVERDVKQEILSASDDEVIHPGNEVQESTSKGQRKREQRGEGQSRGGQRTESQRSGSRSPVRGKGSSNVIEDDARSKTIESRRDEGEGRRRHDATTESSDSETEKKQSKIRLKKLDGSDRKTKQSGYRPSNEVEEGGKSSKRKEDQRKIEKLRRDGSSSDSEKDQDLRKHRHHTKKTKAYKKRERLEDSSDEYSKMLPQHLSKEKLKSRKESKGRHYRRRESSVEESDSSPDRKQSSKIKDEKTKEKPRSEKAEDTRESRRAQSDVARHGSKDKDVSHKQRGRSDVDGAHRERSKERDRPSISASDMVNERSQRENRGTRDRKRSRDRKHSRSFENKENKSDSSDENNLRPSSKDKQLKRENVKEKQEKRSVFAKRNDEQSILAARERYLARKRARIVPETFDDDSD